MFASWDRTSKLLGLASVLVVAFLWFLAAWRWRFSPDFIPLHYTIYFGLDRFGPKSDLALFPTLGTVIVAVHVALAAKQLPKNQFGRVLFLGLSALLSAVLLVSFVLIILKTLY